MMLAKRIERAAERDEVAWYKPGTLMDQLVEGVLSVGSWLTPVDGAGIVSQLSPLERDVFAIALHRQLLQVGRESLQILLVRQYCSGLRAEEVVVPDGQESHQHRQVAFERSGAEVLVHLVKTVQHGAEVVGTDGKHCRKADRRIHRVAPSNPFPDPEILGGVDSDLRYSPRVRRAREKVLRHCCSLPAHPRQ